MTETKTLERPDAQLTYDVDGPLPPADGGRLLLMIGQPMDAGGFATLAGLFPERTVVRYDPRGLGRSTRSDGTHGQDPTVQAADLHALIEALDAGPVDVFASSGGAVTGLALVAAHPEDVATLVAHEPPLLDVLPDADRARRAWLGVQEAYAAKGFGAGMAGFIQMTSWTGEFTDAYFDLPAPDPATFGMPTEDDGSRDDPLLSGVAQAIVEHPIDVDSLTSAATRVVVAVGEESMDTLTGRTSVHAARLLGQEATVFPSHHGGFMGSEHGYGGQPEAFAARLREVLAG